MQETIDQKRMRLLEVVRSYGPVAVTFSGGVDSAVVARAAFEVWGTQAIAVTAVSPSLAPSELDDAKAVAAEIGIPHQVIATREFDVEGYVENAGDRCFYCKDELYRQTELILAELEVSVICNGANLDDLGDHRPGMQAADQHHVRSPLIEAKFTKADVRELAKLWNLSIWNKPAAPCLSSRIAYGLKVTPERVRRVHLAETFLKETFNIDELRVRHEANDLARIEVPEEFVGFLIESDNRENISSQLREYGFKFITIDLDGFRSGSMNDALQLVDFQK